jgi:hypothetical protein
MYRFAIIFLLFLSACMDDDALWEIDKKYPRVSEGVFIVNEGNFWYNNASLSFYDPADRQLFNDVFFHTNSLPLGDVAQSMAIRDSLGYIVLNNSGRIYVINVNTFKYVGKITGLVSPRHIHFISDTKAYVTDLYAKSIAVVNPQTFEVTGNIDVNNNESAFYQHSTDQMVQHGKYVFTNCWSFDDKILVIDTETDQWVDTIKVFIQPKSLAMDKYGKLWILTDGGYEGNPFGHEQPALMRIDALTRRTEMVFRFGIDDYPRGMVLNGTLDTLYFANKHIYRHPVISQTPPEVFLESPHSNNTLGGYYSVGVDPYSSEVYVADAIDLVQPGRVIILKPNATPVDTLKVGIIPGSFTFKKPEAPEF